MLVSLFVCWACRATEAPSDATVPTGDTAPLWGKEPLRVTVDPLFPHHVRALLDVPGAGTGRLACTSDEEAEERHVWEGSAGTQTQVDFAGLLADTPYRCELTVGGTVAAVVSVRTPAPTWTLPDWELSVNQVDLERGYTLFNTWSVGNPTDQKLIVIDPEGRPRFVLPITEPDNGGVEFTWLPQSQRFLAAGGYGYPPTLLTPWGEIASQVGQPESGLKWHHDVEEVADGVVAALSQTVDTAPDGSLYQGFSIEERRIDTGEAVWVWNSQSAVDAGTLDPGQGGPDRYHANALSYVADDPDGPAYWVALAYKNRVVRIDRSTGALTWQLGFRGEFDLVDTTGAGDAFTAGLLHRWSETPRERVRFAAACGALVCGGAGGIDPQPSETQVERFLGGVS